VAPNLNPSMSAQTRVAPVEDLGWISKCAEHASLEVGKYRRPSSSNAWNFVSHQSSVLLFAHLLYFVTLPTARALR